MSEYGIDLHYARECLMTGKYNHITATYFLQLKKNKQDIEADSKISSVKTLLTPFPPSRAISSFKQIFQPLNKNLIEKNEKIEMSISKDYYKNKDRLTQRRESNQQENTDVLISKEHVRRHDVFDSRRDSQNKTPHLRFYACSLSPVSIRDTQNENQINISNRDNSNK